MKKNVVLVSLTQLNMGIILALLSIIFITDIMTPLDFSHSILYLPVLVYSISIPQMSKRFHRVVLAASLIGITANYFWFPHFHGLHEFYIISNNILSAGILILAYVYCRKMHTLNLDNVEISKVVQDQRKTLEDFIDAMPIEVWTANANGVVNYISNSLVTFSGMRREAILENWLSLIHPDDIEKTTDFWTKSIRTEKTYDINFRIRRQDGKYVWHQSHAVPQRNKNGQIQRWLGSASNIDDLHRFREESERLAAQFRHIVESITDAFFTLDHNFCFTYLNNKSAELLENSIDELLGEVIWEKCAIGYNSPFAVHYRHAVETQQALYFEEYFPPSNKWLDVRVYPSTDGLTVYFSDITEKRKEQEQLKLLNTAVSRLNDIIIITKAESSDQQGLTTVFVNDAFEKLTGYSPQEIIGKSPKLLQGPKTDRLELDRIKAALKNKEAIRTQLINYTKTGMEYWIELEIVPLIDNNGDCTHLVSVERDITERIEMEQRLRMSQKLEALGHLTGGVAHDFNNLLMVIMGNTEMLAELMSDSQHRPMIEMTLSAAQRGAELTRKLLSFARRQPLNPKPIDINQLAAAMHALIRLTLPENIELKFVLAPNLGVTDIDSAELDNALLNLVLNARDAMPNGGTLFIETANVVLNSHHSASHSDVKSSEYVMICVSDTGIGMTADTLRQAFEPFFTTKDVGKGSGLGLSMVFGFTKQSGGHPNIYSELGEGTSVKLYFPKVQDALHPSDLPKLALQLLGGKDEHTLIAENDDFVKEHLESKL
ncbi:hypothetical protein A8139_07530 [Marinomonas primoryensis]|uniref:histidine kinase n=1 Tax=Marinomonas primoryensis TaxID=178399 RepID=A0A2Z4PQQ4_9GAMM|nr:PAS domain S-box protein [Marinomonas primoryensis]AWX99861.1 hypothetical protein A8139_07530 [Marinomonas primoryensis]